MRILIVSPKNKTVFNFRGDLIRDMIARGHEVLVTGPNQDYVDDILALGVSEFIEAPVVKDNTSITGDLAVTGSVSLSAGAHVQGDITAGSMSMERGAVVNGTIRIRNAQ